MSQTNPLVVAYLKRREEQLTRKLIGETADELRRLNAKTATLRKAVEERRRERMRQDGPSGFVMVD